MPLFAELARAFVKLLVKGLASQWEIDSTVVDDGPGPRPAA